MNIAIFASGSGTNAQNIAEYFENNPKINVQLILSNNKNAYVLNRAESLGIKSVTFDRKSFYETDEILQILKSEQIDFLILAGFLWLVPINLLKSFPNKIINIHPALLPKFGGKGMYGMKVHEAVVESKEKETGITIHYVNEKYDDGEIIFSAKFQVSGTDTAETVAEKIHKLEYEHFPKIIDKICSQ